MTTNDEALLTSYLLGRLNQDEMLQVEENLLGRDELYETLEETEEHLIEAYVGGWLPNSERESFETYFLRAPERRRRVEFARALQQIGAEHRQAAKSRADSAAVQEASPGLGERLIAWWRSLLAAPQFAALTAACLMLMAGGLVWSLARNQQLRQQLNQEQAARLAAEQKNTAQVESLNRELGDERSIKQQLLENIEKLAGSEEPKQPNYFLATLAAFLVGQLRGGEEITPQQLVIPANADFARLQFPVQTDRFARIDVSLFRLDGAERKEIWQRRGLAAPQETGSNLRVRIPVALLNNGTYALKLTGVGEDNTTESIGEYRFNVLRQR